MTHVSPHELKPLILIDTSTIGGPGRGLIQLLRGFEKKSIPYLLCNFKYSSPKSLEFETEAKKNKFSFYQIAQRCLIDPSPLRDFFDIAKRGGYTLIQSHGYKSHFVAGIVSRLLGIPWVAFTHGWTSENVKIKLYHWLDKIMLRYADVVVAVSPTLWKTFSNIRGPQKKTELILNAIDPEALIGDKGGCSLRNAYVLTPNSILIGCIGRLSYEKGQDVFLNAISQIGKVHSLVKAIVLGDGPYKDSLISLAEKLDIRDKIIFIRHDIAVKDYYEAFDLLVLPSRSEGLPNVVLEAMAFSVPVIATNVGAVSEVIQDGVNGWIVEPNNPLEMSKAIARALSDTDELKNVGRRGKESLFPKFCPEKRVEKILNVYSELP